MLKIVIKTWEYQSKVYRWRRDLLENLGGDLDKVTNQRFLFCAFPLRWYMGETYQINSIHTVYTNLNN